MPPGISNRPLGGNRPPSPPAPLGATEEGTGHVLGTGRADARRGALLGTGLFLATSRL